MNAPAKDRLIALPEVKDIVGLGKTMIYRLEKESDFPKHCKPGGSASRWSEAEVRAWQEEQKAKRAA